MEPMYLQIEQVHVFCESAHLISEITNRYQELSSHEAETC